MDILQRMPLKPPNFVHEDKRQRFTFRKGRELFAAFLWLRLLGGAQWMEKLQSSSVLFYFQKHLTAGYALHFRLSIPKNIAIFEDINYIGLHFLFGGLITFTFFISFT